MRAKDQGEVTHVVEIDDNMCIQAVDSVIHILVQECQVVLV